MLDYERDEAAGLIAQRAIRMTFSEAPVFTEAVVETVIEQNQEALDNADTFEDVLALALLTDEPTPSP